MILENDKGIGLLTPCAILTSEPKISDESLKQPPHEFPNWHQKVT